LKLGKKWISSTTVPFLTNPEELKKVPLIHTTAINYNTFLFRFALPTSDHILGIQTGQHIETQFAMDGKEIIRPYTPISLVDTKGHFDLAIKVYLKGTMGKYIKSFSLGETLDIKGPEGKYIYRAEKDCKNFFQQEYLQ